MDKAKLTEVIRTELAKGLAYHEVGGEQYGAVAARIAEAIQRAEVLTQTATVVKEAANKKSSGTDS